MTIAIAIITVLHLIVAVALVFLILLHAGKGALAERNLDRMTVVVAVLFAATTVSLAILLGR